MTQWCATKAMAAFCLKLCNKYLLIKMSLESATEKHPKAAILGAATEAELQFSFKEATKYLNKYNSALFIGGNYLTRVGVLLGMPAMSTQEAYEWMCQPNAPKVKAKRR